MNPPDRLPDILPGTGDPALRLLIVGFNPSPRSASSGHHYAGRNNQFWRLLAAAGVTPRLLSPAEGDELTRWGVGATNLVARPTRGADELSRAELRAGVPRLKALAAAHRPRALAYSGKGVYLAAAGRARAPWGLQADSLVAGVADVVLPSPSGRVRMSFEAKLEHYRLLTRFLR